MSMYYLRDVEEGDHEWLVELHNDPLVLRNLTDPSPITMESHMNWWKSLNKKKNPRKIFCEQISDPLGKSIGFCKFYNVDTENRNCVLGADIHESHRGKGLAKTMWKTMLNYCFSDLGLHRVGLTTAEYNTIARRVYSDIGFSVEGISVESLYRDDKYYNQYCMFLMKKTWEKTI